MAEAEETLVLVGTAEAEGGRKDEAVRPEEVSEGPRWAVAAEFMPKEEAGA